jgi:hypothetical protein
MVELAMNRDPVGPIADKQCQNRGQTITGVRRGSSSGDSLSVISL